MQYPRSSKSPDLDFHKERGTQWQLLKYGQWASPNATEEEQWNQVNPSCLLAYLGIRGFANMVEATSKDISKNALPILAYYDIFKNYYANTQEENFYVIGNTEEVTVIINGTEVNPNVIASNEGRIDNTGVITITPNTIKQNELQIKVSKDSPIGQSVTLAPEDIGTWQVIGEAITITTNKVPEGKIWYIRSRQTKTKRRINEIN